MQLADPVRRDLVARLRRIEGQARGLQRMLDEGRECGEVIQQVAAMRAALAKVAMTVVAENLEECLRTGGEAKAAALAEAKRAFLDLV